MFIPTYIYVGINMFDGIDKYLESIHFRCEKLPAQLKEINNIQQMWLLHGIRL